MTLSSEESLRLQTSKEGQFFERKSAVDHSPGGPKARKPKEVAWDIAETLSAMANADGGELVIGMENDGSVSGLPFDAEKERFLRQVPTGRDYVSPPLPCRVQTVETIEGKQLLHFLVDWSPEVHSLTNSKCFLRRQDKNLPFPSHEVAALKALKTQGLYERTFPPNATVDDLDLGLVSRSLKTDDVLGVLKDRYVLLEERNGRVVPCLAALLLFGKNVMKWHPRTHIDFTRFEGNERKYGSEMNVTKRFRVEAPLCELIPKANEAIQPFIKERQRLHDLFFREKLEYPTFAWQEAVVNAVAHRNYSLQGAPIEVWMFDDRMEIRSPGLPPAPVTLESLSRGEKMHFSRHPLLVRVLTDLSLMRDQGEGIPRMFDEMDKAGYYPPHFETIGNAFFQVTLRNQPVYDDATLTWFGQFKGIDLTLEQKRLLAMSHAQGGRFTSRECQKLTGSDIYGSSNLIKDLIRKGVARSTEKGSRVYQIVEPLRAKPEMPEELVRLLPLLRKKGFIANEDIRQGLKISEQAARRLAGNLCDMGWLSSRGKKRWKRYGLGPRSINQS